MRDSTTNRPGTTPRSDEFIHHMTNEFVITGRLIICLLVLASLAGTACRASKPTSATQTGGQPAGAGSSPSATTNLRAGIGFATRQKFIDHYEKHGREFGSLSQEEYLSQAQELRDRPAGGEVLEAVRADGVITRFDRRTGAFLAFNPDLSVVR